MEGSSDYQNDDVIRKETGFLGPQRPFGRTLRSDGRFFEERGIGNQSLGASSLFQYISWCIRMLEYLSALGFVWPTVNHVQPSLLRLCRLPWALKDQRASEYVTWTRSFMQDVQSTEA